MVDESSNEMNDDSTTDDVIETEKFDVIYSCLRCNTKVSNSELNRLPEIKCICGFPSFYQSQTTDCQNCKSNIELSINFV